MVYWDVELSDVPAQARLEREDGLQECVPWGKSNVFMCVRSLDEVRVKGGLLHGWVELS